MLCTHSSLDFKTSPFAADVGFQCPSAEDALQTLVAAGPIRKRPKTSKATSSKPPTSQTHFPPISTYPEPLVLPDDEIALDPQYPSQSLQDWIDEEHRNKVTGSRKTVYVVPPPGIAESVSFMNDWTVPQSVQRLAKHASSNHKKFARQPENEAIVDYVRAFYTGLPVKMLPSSELEFVAWDSETADKKAALTKGSTDPIGLSTGKEAIRIRCRKSHDKHFAGQLNLNDLLDVAIDILPKDAYALLMIVHHDLFEGDDDDFCCGRAYGGSRIAVVSTARYRPELHPKTFDVEHIWPASHCKAFLSRMQAKGTKAVRRPDEPNQIGTGMRAAVDAHSALPAPTSASELSTMWLGSVCKTASHELGHCFGIDHCMYLACVMQGTAGMAEDLRQPPYLCPVDSAKVAQATGADENDRCEALLRFCVRFDNDRMFSSFGAWLRHRLGQLKVKGATE